LFYVDQLGGRKVPAKALIRHLISLRVRLSTSKIAWTADFVDHAEGLQALEKVLGRYVTVIPTAR
jgi:hypothetical protein